ncbi:MAG: hypothetical protein OXN16_04590, partial [Gammaproteobacteria bacterium]|nr:hypothetical protein [Gammaproteobacteria bacterium]
AGSCVPNPLENGSVTQQTCNFMPYVMIEAWPGGKILIPRQISPSSWAWGGFGILSFTIAN